VSTLTPQVAHELCLERQREPEQDPIGEYANALRADAAVLGRVARRLSRDQMLCPGLDLNRCAKSAGVLSQHLTALAAALEQERHGTR
jgi:hypothetical protein